MEEVWEVSEENVIHLPSGETVSVEGEITAEKIKEVARSRGIKKFTVEDEEGYTLTASDFPRSGEVFIKEYNEAKGF